MERSSLQKWVGKEWCCCNVFQHAKPTFFQHRKWWSWTTHVHFFSLAPGREFYWNQASTEGLSVVSPRCNMDLIGHSFLVLLMGSYLSKCLAVRGNRNCRSLTNGSPENQQTSRRLQVSVEPSWLQLNHLLKLPGGVSNISGVLLSGICCWKCVGFPCALGSRSLPALQYQHHLLHLGNM